MPVGSHQHFADSLDIHRVLGFLQRLLDCCPSSFNHFRVKSRHDFPPVVGFWRVSDLHKSVDIVLDIRDRMLISLTAI